MYRVSIKLQRHEGKFGRTQPAGKCFHSFSEFFQTFTSVYNSIETTYFLFLLENMATKKGKQLVNFDYQNVNSLCLHHHYINSSCLVLCFSRVIETQVLTNQRVYFLETVFQYFFLCGKNDYPHIRKQQRSACTLVYIILSWLTDFARKKKA